MKVFCDLDGGLFYKGLIDKLEENQVFVFGSNEQGFHGAGSAGFASFGVPGNMWRKFDYANKPNGWKGKWNVKGCASGFQTGTEGMSYALLTCKSPGDKKSYSGNRIRGSIYELYKFALTRMDYQFLIAYTIKLNLNGYSPKEMATFFWLDCIPSNIVFEETFRSLVYVHGR